MGILSAQLSTLGQSTKECNKGYNYKAHVQSNNHTVFQAVKPRPQRFVYL